MKFSETNETKQLKKCYFFDWFCELSEAGWNGFDCCPFIHSLSAHELRVMGYKFVAQRTQPQLSLHFPLIYSLRNKQLSLLIH